MDKRKLVPIRVHDKCGEQVEPDEPKYWCLCCDCAVYKNETECKMVLMEEVKETPKDGTG